MLYQQMYFCFIGSNPELHDGHVVFLSIKIDHAIYGVSETSRGPPAGLEVL